MMAGFIAPPQQTVPLLTASALPRTGIERIFCTGHSQSVRDGGFGNNSSLYWAKTFTPLRLAFDPNVDSIGVGGSNASAQTTAPAGLLSTQRLADMQARVAAGRLNCLLHSGSNDAGTPAETTLARTIAFHQAFRAAGGRRLFIQEQMPCKGAAVDFGTAAASSNVIAFNRAARAYCDATSDAHFVPAGGTYADPTSAYYYPIGTTTGGAGTPTIDGTHWNALGASRYGRVLANVLAPHFSAPWPLACSQADLADPASGVRGNVLGSRGIFAGTAGGNAPTSSCTLSGAANAPAGYYIFDGEAAITLAFSTGVAQPWLSGQLGRPDAVRPRVTISGTPQNSGSFSLVADASYTVGANVPMDAWAVLYATNLTGVTGIGLNLTMANSVGGGVAYGYGSGASSDSPIDSYTGPLLLQVGDSMMTQAGTTQLRFAKIMVSYMAGQPLSGSLDLLSFILAPRPAFPAALTS